METNKVQAHIQFPTFMINDNIPFFVRKNNLQYQYAEYRFEIIILLIYYNLQKIFIKNRFFFKLKILLENYRNIFLLSIYSPSVEFLGNFGEKKRNRICVFPPEGFSG